MKKLDELSIFFPAYNEAANIEEAIRQALAVARTVAEKYEVIVVDDGSKDATLPIARRLARRYKAVRVVTQKNKGYGGALKLGFASARFDWIFFSDSDLQFDLSELKKFIRHTDTHDLVIGYRKNRAEGIKRQMLARALKIWNKVLLSFPMRIRDIDCAFKLMHRRVIRHADPFISDGAMFSTELLLKSYRNKFAIKQIGVTHYLRRAGVPTGSNHRVILRAVRDTFILKRHLLSRNPAVRWTTASLRNLRQLAFQ